MKKVTSSKERVNMHIVNFQKFGTLVRLHLQNQPDLGMPCLGILGRQLVFKIFDYLPYMQSSNHQI